MAEENFVFNSDGDETPVPAAVHLCLKRGRPTKGLFMISALTASFTGGLPTDPVALYRTDRSDQPFAKARFLGLLELQTGYHYKFMGEHHVGLCDRNTGNAVNPSYTNLWIGITGAGAATAVGWALDIKSIG